MKDLKKLIRKVLREDTNQPDVELDIMDYKGDNSEIKNLKLKIRSGMFLTKGEVKMAENFFSEKTKPEEVQPEFDVEDSETDELDREKYLKNFKEELN
jgi:hypothetical protein